MLLMCSQIPVVMDKNAKEMCVSKSPALKVRETITQYSVSSDLKLLAISSKEKDYLDSFKPCNSIHSQISNRAQEVIALLINPMCELHTSGLAGLYYWILKMSLIRTFMKVCQTLLIMRAGAWLDSLPWFNVYRNSHPWWAGHHSELTEWGYFLRVMAWTESQHISDGLI